ncbi:fidgetin-like protein 2 isoform X1 [Myxocyprinus asiaticus]|uniref:fidgetin-like protein 2 isoform X1 n=2 Tax=Myxocyprinus asiaticus TaxID=70543 RepID=UPI0022222D87|nr:fidgetin-like protein 2 isoform X1 [Myxocyprinus asiaticus]XP_051516022.1 fidgetin-like protein 2 isoform X1 [Myxocyprinus asiaticus]
MLSWVSLQNYNHNRDQVHRMLSPIVPYSLLKMHWNPEHAQPLSQWPEQHLDVSSTTSSPAHKSELYPSRSRGSYSYAWANDDISALTASNLLKRYAEKYSGMLDSPYERTAVGAYPEPGAFGALNGGQKSELEPWPLTHSTDGPYPLVLPSSHSGLTGPKVVPTSAGPPGSGSVSAVNSNLSDSGYSGSSSCSGPHSSDYPPSYNGTYITSGYCPQPSSALPPASLHALQPNPTLLPSYTPSTPVYNYPPSTYPHQTSLAPSYSHPPAPYIPSGIAAPSPLPSRPTVVGGSYGYQNSSLGGSEPGGSLKRKAFEMNLEEEDGDSSRYRKYSYDPMKDGGDSPYGVTDKAECHGNSFGTASTDPQAFKPSKPSSQSSLEGDEVGKYSGLKPLVSPPYGAAGDYSPPAGMTGENGGGEQAFSQHCSQKRSDSLKNMEPRMLELVSRELQDCSPAVLWNELAGYCHIKAALEEDLMWPVLRSNPAIRPPRTVLLFGPQGGGKTKLVRSMASQLGATFYRLSGATLASKLKGEAEQLLVTLFSVARQPAVVLLSEVESIEEEGLRQQLQAQLEKTQHGQTNLVLVVCTTRRPDLIKDSLLRCFSKRYHVGLPDGSTRRQVLLQALAPQGCSLSEREMAAVLQRSEGFSIWELLQLCQQALASASASVPVPLHGLPAPLSSPAFQDFENAFCKVRSHSTPKELDTCMEWSKVYSR